MRHTTNPKDLQRGRVIYDKAWEKIWQVSIDWLPWAENHKEFYFDDHYILKSEHTRQHQWLHIIVVKTDDCEMCELAKQDLEWVPYIEIDAIDNMWLLYDMGIGEDMDWALSLPSPLIFITDWGKTTYGVEWRSKDKWPELATALANEYKSRHAELLEYYVRTKWLDTEPIEQVATSLGFLDYLEHYTIE